MLASVTVFIFNDALIKLAFDHMPPVQAIGLRGIFATLWCLLALLVCVSLPPYTPSAHHDHLPAAIIIGDFTDA